MTALWWGFITADTCLLLMGVALWCRVSDDEATKRENLEWDAYKVPLFGRGVR